MKKSVDLVHTDRYNKVFLTNTSQNEEDPEIDDENYTSLSRVYTLGIIKDSQGKPISINEPNTAITKRKKLFQKEYNKNKIEKNNEEEINSIKNPLSRNTWVKKTKNEISKKNCKSNYYVKKNIIENNNSTSFNIAKDENVTDTISNNDFSKDNDSEFKEMEEIKEIKDSIICYICLMKVTSPKMCPNCHKIACEKCLKNWFISKNNRSCGYCRAVMTFDKMISVPILNNVANLIEKISTKTNNNNNKANRPNSNYFRYKNKMYCSNINELDNNIDNNINNEDSDDLDNNINLNNYTKVSNAGMYKKIQPVLINKNNSVLSKSTHSPYISLKHNQESLNNENNNNKNNTTIDYCTKHPDQPLYYYCVNCSMPYCRTCFVFFGDEKDKHINHNIIEYENYKKMSIPEAIKDSDKLNDIHEELNAYIKRCEALKDCYEFERKSVENHVNSLMTYFNNKIDENIKILDNTIKIYKSYLAQIEKCQIDIKKYFNRFATMRNGKFEQNLIEKLNNINNIKYFNSKEIDNFSDLSNNMLLKVYQTKLKKYEIKQKNFHFKTALENSKYQLAITQKGNEVQIYIYCPEESATTNDEQNKKNEIILPFVFLRRKNKNWESFQLTENLTYKGNCYFIKRFTASNFCTVNSYFKIKGVLYESSIE